MRKDRLTTAANHKATPPGARPRCRWAGANRQPWEQPVPKPSRPDLRPLDGAEAQMSSPTPHRTRGPRLPPLPPVTCGEPWFGGGLLHGHGEGGGRRRRLCPGQRPVAAEGHGDAGGLHGRLEVPQLVDALLFQEERLLGRQAALLQGAPHPHSPHAARPAHLPARVSHTAREHTGPLAPDGHQRPQEPQPAGGPPGGVGCRLGFDRESLVRVPDTREKSSSHSVDAGASLAPSWPLAPRVLTRDRKGW